MSQMAASTDWALAGVSLLAMGITLYALEAYWVNVDEESKRANSKYFNYVAAVREKSPPSSAAPGDADVVGGGEDDVFTFAVSDDEPGAGEDVDPATVASWDDTWAQAPGVPPKLVEELSDFKIAKELCTEDLQFSLDQKLDWMGVKNKDARRLLCELMAKINF